MHKLHPLNVIFTVHLNETASVIRNTLTCGKVIVSNTLDTQ